MNGNFEQDFLLLSDEDKKKVFSQMNPDFASMDSIEQDKVIQSIKPKETIQPETQTSKPENVPDWMAEHPNLAGLYGAVKAVAQPVLEAGGLIGGGLLGAPAGPLGTVAGAGLGYAGAKEAIKGIETLAGERQPQTIPQGLQEAGEEALTGAKYEMGGQIAGKILPVIGKGLKKAYTEVAGLTTTQGSKAFEDALSGSPAFKEAMRGKEDQLSILQKAKDAFQQLKVNRRLEYQKNLDDIMNQTGVQIEKQPLLDKINNIVDKFGITKNAKGKYVFTKDSNIDFQSRSALQKLLKQIDEFGGTSLPPELQALKNSPALKLNPELQNMINSSAADTLTPKQADNLKQLIDDFYSKSSNAQALTNSLRDVVKKSIVEKVPQYETMMKNYQEASNAITEIDKALTLGKGKNIDTALRKMQTMTRPINDYRLSQAERLSPELSQLISGLAVNPVMPRGFFSRVFAGSPFAMGYLLHNPALYAASPMFSPRAMGELSYLLGNVGKTAGKYIDPAMAAKILMLMNQSGRQ